MTEEEAKKQIANPDAIDRKRRSIRQCEVFGCYFIH